MELMRPFFWEKQQFGITSFLPKSFTTTTVTTSVSSSSSTKKRKREREEGIGSSDDDEIEILDEPLPPRKESQVVIDLSEFQMLRSQSSKKCDLT
jgi:hypothetical protein